MIREDPEKLNKKEKDALLGLIMKSLPLAPRFNNSIVGKSDFNQFRHSFHNWAILLHENRLDLHVQKMVLFNCFEAKGADRIRPLPNKSLDRACKSLSTLMSIVKDQFFPVVSKWALMISYIGRKQGGLSLLDFFNEKEAYHQWHNPGGESLASYDEFYSSFLQNRANISLATKIQEAGPRNLDQLRLAVID